MIFGATIGKSQKYISQVGQTDCGWMLLGDLEIFSNDVEGSPFWSYVAKNVSGVIEPRPYRRGYFKDEIAAASPKDYYITRVYQSPGQFERERDEVLRWESELQATTIVQVRDPEIVGLLPDRYMVGISPGPAWQEAGLWDMTDQDVWIIGGEPRYQWQMYTELMIVGANIEGIIADMSVLARYSFRGIYIGVDPYIYSPAPSSEDQGEVIRRTIRNVDKFWRLMCPEKKPED